MSVTGSTEVAGEVDNGVVVDATLHHAVDLDWMEADLVGALDSAQYAVGAVATAVHLSEYFIIQRVQADCDAAQTGVFQGLGLPSKKVAVGGEGQVIYTLYVRQHAHEAFQIGADQRFTTCKPHLVHTQLSEEAYKPGDFLEGQQLGFGEELVAFPVDFGGHAVGAAEVAPVGDGRRAGRARGGASCRGWLSCH